jgi:hypothetical protein
MTRRSKQKRRKKNKFSERPLPQRVAIIALGLVEVALLFASEADIQRRPADQVRGPKLLWRLICLINIFGPLSYFRWGRQPEANQRAQPTSP